MNGIALLMVWLASLPTGLTPHQREKRQNRQECIESASAKKLSKLLFATNALSLTTMHAKERNVAAVFVGLRLSAVGTECEVLWFLLVGCTLLTLRKACYLEDLLSDCWSDQQSCELVLRRTSYSWTCWVVHKAFSIELLANTQFEYEKF